MLVEDTKPKTIIEFFNTLTEKINKETSPAIPKNYCEKYRHVIREYSELTRFFLDMKSCEASRNLKTVRFSTVDDHNREHPLEVKINWDSDIHELFEVDNLNLPITKGSFKTSNTLRDLYDQFKMFIENLQPFFDLMELLDEQCWVLDPVPPNRCCRYRRIAIGKLDIFCMRFLRNLFGCFYDIQRFTEYLHTIRPNTEFCFNEIVGQMKANY